MQIQLEQDSWRAFRRTLRKEDQEAFDALWRAARKQVASCAMSQRVLPFESIVMAMLLELAKQGIMIEKHLSTPKDDQPKLEH